jgi:hypothetical protein
MQVRFALSISLFFSRSYFGVVEAQQFAVWEKDAKEDSGFLGWCYLDLYPRGMFPPLRRMLPNICPRKQVLRQFNVDHPFWVRTLGGLQELPCHCYGRQSGKAHSWQASIDEPF